MKGQTKSSHKPKTPVTVINSSSKPQPIHFGTYGGSMKKGSFACAKYKQ